ncbi:MAG: hypothetical protein SVU32_08705, partial [Candidatus Nanohaloarchaea archaeon]|nr:hypothetical protein [Candidatus Nanohaloarchaea archaeon]
MSEDEDRDGSDEEAIICNRRGEKEELDDHKLYASIYHPARECSYSEKEAEELAEEVSSAVMDWIRDHKHDVVTS